MWGMGAALCGAPANLACIFMTECKFFVTFIFPLLFANVKPYVFMSCLNMIT